ncbi:MAG: DUF2344 domain-containing protein [Oscillospiraceae bacterium]|nr:DUF2344 domain-containing protein [Oscillospiraceae bacterium]
MNVRIRYSKTGRAKYISHLDMLRTFQRAFARAGIDLVHSEGFNPHPKLNLVLPLPTCCESLCEYLDAGVNGEYPDLCGRLNAALPEGIRMLSAAEPVMKAGSVRFASWSTLLRLDGASPQKTAEYAARVLSAPELPVVKKTKRGESVVDLKKYMTDLGVTTEDAGVRIGVTLPTFEPSLTPRNILAALPELPEYVEYTVRTEIYNEKMEPFC